MLPDFINRGKLSLQSNMLQRLVFIAAVVVSLYAAIFLKLDDRGILLSIIAVIAVILAFVAFQSKKTWIPILICLMLVRDFNLGGLMGGATLKIGDIFIAYIFCLWMIGDVFIKNSTSFIKSKLDLFIILFVFIHILSLLWSTDFEYGLLRVLKLIRNFIFYIIIRELYICDFLNSYKRMTASYIGTGLVLLVVHSSVVLSAGGFSDFLLLSQKATLTSVDLGALRVRGTGGGFLITGPSMWFMITGAFIFGSLVLTDSRIVGRIKILLAILMFAASLLMLSRSTFGMLAILLMLLFLGSLYLKSKRNIIAISVMLFVFMVAGIALGLGDIYQKRFKNAFHDGSWTQRVDLYRPAIDAFVENPVAGIGVGSNYSWQANYPEIGESRSRIVHSAYLLVLSELGMSGLIIFLVIIYFWLRYLWDCLLNSRSEPRVRSICMTMFAFSVSYLMYILIVGEFEAFEPWLVMAIASAVKNLNMPAIGISNPVLDTGMS